MLSQDNRLGHSVDVPVDIKVNDDGFVDALLTDKAIAYKSQFQRLWLSESSVNIWKG